MMVAIILNHWANAIPPLYCNLQDNESESQKVEIGVAGPIFIKTKSKPLWDSDIHTTQHEQKT